MALTAFGVAEELWDCRLRTVEEGPEYFHVLAAPEGSTFDVT